MGDYTAAAPSILLPLNIIWSFRDTPADGPKHTIDSTFELFSLSLHPRGQSDPCFSGGTESRNGNHQ